MNRKLLGGALAIVVLLVGAWLVWPGGGDDAPADDAAGRARSGKLDVGSAAPRPAGDRPARRGALRWTLDRDREGPLRLEGQVIGPDGQGVGGAEVWLASVPPRSTKTEGDGSFAFDKLVGRTYQLTASAGDRVGGPVPYKLTATSDPVVIRLVDSARIEVTVHDARDQPIAGAEVRTAELPRATARTDDAGAAVLRPVRPGWVAVQATAPGYAPGLGFATVGSAGAVGKLAITLRQGFAVTGRVLDEAGAPIAGARIAASGGVWGPMGADDADVSDEVVSDAKGRFEIPALAAGDHTLTAIDGEHAPGHATIKVADAPLTGVEVVMKTGGVIAGKVVDAAGKPAPFATVRIAGAGAAMWNVAARQTTTDDAGAFELRGLPRTRLTARAESDQAASALVAVDLTTRGSERELRIVLDVTGAIAGVVVDDQGAPVPEVQVHAFPDILGGESTDGLALAGMSSASTDGAGAFTIRGLPDGSYRLWASRETASTDWGLRGQVARTGATGVRLVLAAGGQLVGKIVVDGGDPPAVANVQVGRQAPTAAIEGAFTIKDLTPGRYVVRFRGPEFAELVQHDVEIQPGRTTDLGTVTVHRGRRLVGKVVDASGAPVEGAKVKVAQMLFDVQGAGDAAEAMEQAAGVRSAITDRDGAFSIIGLPKQATHAMADHATGRSPAVAIPAGTEDPPPVTLTLRGFGSIAGTVVQQGKPVAGATITDSARGSGPQATFARTDDAGHFTLSRVTEGPHVLQAMQQQLMAFKSTSVTVDVVSGKQTKVTIDIPVGQITLAIAIKPLPGNQVDAAQVFLFTGEVNVTTGKQLVDRMFQGGAQGMKLWFGADKPPAEFDQLVPGGYSVCTIPLTGVSLADPRLQENIPTLKVYCRPVTVAAAPAKQTFVHEVPAMDPLPTPDK